MKEEEMFKVLRTIKNLSVPDWLPILKFNILVKVKHIENIPIDHRFGRIIHNPNPVLTNGSEPYCYQDTITMDELKQQYAEQGMSKESLDRFDQYELVRVFLMAAEEQRGAMDGKVYKQKP